MTKHSQKQKNSTVNKEGKKSISIILKMMDDLISRAFITIIITEFYMFNKLEKELIIREKKTLTRSI